MKRAVFAVSAIAIAITSVSAQSDPQIARRKAIMKELGAQARTGVAMAKGEAPYDQTRAKALFHTYAEAAEQMPSLFPQTSKTGGDTAALPAIWTNPADFQARFIRFYEEAHAAEYNVTDLESFKGKFSNVMRHCGGCHETYRAKKS